MIPTSGSPDKTVCTFFTNNGRRFLAWGVGLFYVSITSEDYFNAVKDTLQNHDIPTQEIGDQDCRVYGVELVGREEIQALVGSTPVHDLVDSQTHTLAEMIGFIDLNANHAAGRSFYKVVRCNDIDYAYAPGVFIFITDPDHYGSLLESGFISTPHGEARVIDRSLLEFIQSEAQRAAAPGVKLDTLDGPAA
jgi:hypothetical protein